ncbi:MAG: hypothetical protein ACOX0Q_07700 [Syntrophomonadaceae bacterium]
MSQRDKELKKFEHLKFEVAQEMGIKGGDKSPPPQKEIKKS